MEKNIDILPNTAGVERFIRDRRRETEEAKALRQFVTAARVLMFRMAERRYRDELNGDEQVALAAAEDSLENLGRLIS